MSSLNLIEKLRKNKEDKLTRRLLENRLNYLEALEFIQREIEKELNEGETTIAVCKTNHIRICKQLFANATQYCFGDGTHWHRVDITENGIKKLERELKKARKEVEKDGLDTE